MDASAHIATPSPAAQAPAAGAGRAPPAAGEGTDFGRILAQLQGASGHAPGCTSGFCTDAGAGTDLPPWLDVQGEGLPDPGIGPPAGTGLISNTGAGSAGNVAMPSARRLPLRISQAAVPGGNELLVARDGVDQAASRRTFAPGSGAGDAVIDVLTETGLFDRVEPPRGPPALPHAGSPAGTAAVVNLNLDATGTAGPVQQPVRLDIAPPLQHPQWADAVGERVVWQAGNHVQLAHLNLNPPELGPLEVRVELSKDQAQVHFIVHHGSVRDAVEDALPRLRELFASSGLELSGASVSAHSGRERGSDAPLARGSHAGPEPLAALAPLALAIPSLRMGLIDAYV
ncbi:MAG: flagellar hook-length control protein FliK [Gammaproteobacteria bacterium]|nr:flagellar hook-length control protein FliK [Gammaproteobacteria bacterium]